MKERQIEKKRLTNRLVTTHWYIWDENIEKVLRWLLRRGSLNVLNQRTDIIQGLISTGAIVALDSVSMSIDRLNFRSTTTVENFTFRSHHMISISFFQKLDQRFLNSSIRSTVLPIKVKQYDTLKRSFLLPSVSPDECSLKRCSMEYSPSDIHRPSALV